MSDDPKQQKRAPIFRLGPGVDAHFDGVTFTGVDIAVEARDSNVRATNVTFNNVRQPWDIDGFGDVSMEGTRIKNDPKLSEEPQRRTSMGWRRGGPPVPAQCPNCKTVFPSRNYDFGTPRFRSRDNEETCPECRNEHAKVADGLFDLTTDAVRIIQGSDLTHAMLSAIAAVAQDNFNGSISADETVKRFDDIDPRIGQIAKSVSDGSNTGLSYFSAIVGCAALLASIVVIGPTLESRDLSREQTKIAREALELQKAPNPTEAMMKKAAQDLSDIKFTLHNGPQRYADKTGQQPGATPSEREAPPKTGSVDLAPKGKPKARHLKSRAKADRRRAFSRRHPGPSCD